MLNKLDWLNNLLHRDFQAAEPNQKWLSDITFIRTDEGFLYLAAILAWIFSPAR